MLVEVCAYSLESCLNAEAAGAGRIELCGGIGEGGTTPSGGLITQVKRHIRLPVYVMIRPRGGDFVYDDRELELMETDIHLAKSLGADGVVLGALNENGTVQEEVTSALIRTAFPLGVTFHRAFDLTPDPAAALEAVIRCGAERILTSGQQSSALKGLETIKKLVRLSENRIEIMAGAGVSTANTALLREAQVHCIHLTGKAFRPGKQSYFPDSVSMAGEQPDERSIMYSDPLLLKEIVKQAHGQ